MGDGSCQGEVGLLCPVSLGLGYDGSGAYIPHSGILDQFGPPGDHFRGQKAMFKTIWGLKKACFAHETALWGHPEGDQGSKNGSVIHTL